MLLPFVSGVKLINEELTPGHISLVSAKEGPLGATYRLSFAVEVLCDISDIEAAAAEQGMSPEDMQAPNKAENIQELIDGLHYEDIAADMYERMMRYGIEDVVKTVTEDEFIQLLHFLREEGRLDVALKLKRPDYWSNVKTYVDQRGNEQQVRHTDLRAGSSARQLPTSAERERQGEGGPTWSDALSKNYAQKTLSQVWASLAEQAQDQIITQILDLFSEFPPGWRNVIFGGNDLENVSMQLYKGNEKFNNKETVGHPSKCQCQKCKEYEDSWHYPYRTQEEMQGRTPYAYEQEKWQKLATDVKRLVDKVQRKLRKAKTPEDKEYYSTRLTDLMAKGERLVDKMQAVEGDIATSGKKVLFVYVTVDIERFVRTVSVMFRRHMKRQGTDEAYAQSSIIGKSKDGQVVEKWSSGLAGLKDLALTLGKSSHDDKDGGGIYGEILDVLSDAMGDCPVIDIDNDGNVFYVPYDQEIVGTQNTDTEPAIKDLFGDTRLKDGEAGGHETGDQPKRLPKKPGWTPQTFRPTGGGGSDYSESIEKIAKSL